MPARLVSNVWSTENALIWDILLAARTSSASQLLSSDLSAEVPLSGKKCGGWLPLCETFQPYKTLFQ